MTANANEKAAARKVAEALNVHYALALRLLRTARETDPPLRGPDLIARCRDILRSGDRIS